MRPVRIAIVNDYPIVVAGVAAMLAHESQIAVIELESGAPVTADVDVVLFDGFAQQGDIGARIATLAATGHAKVVVYTWAGDEESVGLALAAGAAGHLSKGLSTTDLVAALVAVRDGAVVTGPAADRPARTYDAPPAGDWPGRHAGLTPRESEILAYVARGLGNREIAEQAGIALNSLKTHIRSTYRKIGVTRRSQAIVWSVQNGFHTR